MAHLIEQAVRKKLIGEHPFFVLLNEQEVSALAILFEEKKIEKGKVIVEVGSIVDAIYLIASGEAEVVRKIMSADKFISLPVAVLHQGEAIGLAESKLSSKEGLRTATVKALTDITLLYLPFSQFEEFFHNSILYKNMSKILFQAKILNFLKELEPFTELPLEDIQWLAKRIKQVSLPAGKIVFHQGDPGDQCYFIESGEVGVIYTDENNISTNLATLSTQDIFGEIAILTNSARTATVKAITDCRLFVLNRDDFHHILNRFDDASRKMHFVMKLRNRPYITDSIEVYQQETPEGEKLNIIKNTKQKKYYRLTPQSWFIWQQINGAHSLRVIYESYKREFKTSNIDFVKETLSDLYRLGFIGFTFKHHYQKTSSWRRLFNKLKRK